MSIRRRGVWRGRGCGDDGFRRCKIGNELEVGVSLLTVFLESFLDGLTLGGFFKRLRRPGAATQMFAQVPPRSDWQSVTFEQASDSAES